MSDTPTDEQPSNGRETVVDGGDLPKFEPTFELERWDTDEGSVIGVRYEGPEVPSGADRVAFVRAAMEHRSD